MMATATAVRTLEFPTAEEQRFASLADVLSGLSFALDLAAGAVPGHTLRSCVLGMRLAQETGLSRKQRACLYFALLLKDAGGSSNAARLCQVLGGGDERRVRAGVKLEDWSRPGRPQGSALQLLWHNVLPGSGALERLAGMAYIGLTQHRNNEEMIGLRCERGTEIVRRLGLGEAAAQAVRGLDEHWDGSGYPDRRMGKAIPVESRMMAVAQHLDTFATEKGTDRAVEVLRERSRRWFDPELVRVVERLHGSGSLWRGALARTPESETRRLVLELSPDGIGEPDTADIDLICEVFAEVIDAKSPFTLRHSLGVTGMATRIADEMGLSDERKRLMHRAALLHDLGKLSVPNSILDKPGELSREEWQVVRESPRLTREILSRIGCFQDVAQIAEAHHERMDGSGYPHGLRGEQLPLEARILQVADVYGALRESRPYRSRMSSEQALESVAGERGRGLDSDCCDALFAIVAERQSSVRCFS